jgi:hypothetical protein
MGLGMIAYNSVLEQGREAMLELDKFPLYFIDDDSTAKWCAATKMLEEEHSTAKWCAATEMPEEELTKCKILLDWIVKEMKNNGGRFLQGATSTAASDAISFSQFSKGDAKNAVMNKLRQQKSPFSLLIIFEERLMLQVLEVASRGMSLVILLRNQKNASWNVLKSL